MHGHCRKILISLINVNETLKEHPVPGDESCWYPRHPLHQECRTKIELILHFFLLFHLIIISKQVAHFYLFGVFSGNKLKSKPAVAAGVTDP